MQDILSFYQEQLIYIFTKSQCHSLDGDYLIILKNETEIKPIDHCVIMHYQDDFESLLKFKLPSKMRKIKQLLPYHKTCDIINRTNYGILSFSVDDIPYSVGLNHVFINNHIYFHCAQDGFKLNGIGQKASFLIVEDLGINLEAGTHNHQSVFILGTLKQIDAYETKKTVLLQLVNKLAPSHPYHDKMLSFTNVLELEIDYMIGKTHIR